MGGDENLLPGTNEEGIEELNKSITLLERTRERVIASQTNPRGKGHLLDKALAKQILLRKEKLDSVESVNKTLNKDSEDQQSETSQLHRFLIDLEVTSPPQILPRHPFTESSPLDTCGGDVDLDVETLSSTGLSIQCSEMDFTETTTNLNKKILKFQRLERLYNPEKYEVKSILENKKERSSKLEEALMEVVEMAEELTLHQEAGEDLKNNAKKVIDETEAKFQMFVNGISKKAASPTASGVTTPVPEEALGSGSSTPSGDDSRRETLSQSTKVAKVNISIDADIVASEAKSLTAEIRKFADWGSAESHEVEIAMGKKADWRKRFKKIKEKGWAVR